MIALIGGDNGSGDPGITRWSLNGGLPVSGTLDFHWIYFSSDDPFYDFSGFHYDGNDFGLTTFDGSNGHVILNGVVAGQDFGFYVSTVDNDFGAGAVILTSFSVPDGGSTLLLLAGGLIALVGVNRRIRWKV